MLIEGEWLLCPDRVIRPILRGDVRSGDKEWKRVPFLVDTGADKTILSASILDVLGLQQQPPSHGLGGIGGIVDYVLVDTQVRFLTKNATPILFNIRLAAATNPQALDMSVLGRDILDLFTLIVERIPQHIYLLRDQHRYTIEQA